VRRRQGSALRRRSRISSGSDPRRQRSELARSPPLRFANRFVKPSYGGPGLTARDGGWEYEESVNKLTGGKGRLESPADWPVEGLSVHIAGQGENGGRVVDVWESEDAFRRFGETLMPILQEIGVEDQPEIYPTHTFVSG
jgi:hypothetical protein